MNHPTEAMLEAWIRNNDPDPGTRTAIAEHIRSCTACGKVEDFLRSIITELDGASTGVPPSVHRFADSLAPQAAVIRLSSFHSDRAREGQTTAAPYILAARSAEHQPRFRPVAVLASPDGNTLLRLVHDAAENILRASIAGHTGPALIEIPAWNILVATDALGTGKVPMPASCGPTDALEASVFPALEACTFSIDLGSQTVAMHPANSPTSGILCTLADQTVSIAIPHGGTSRPVRWIAVWPADDQPVIHDVNSGPVRLHLIEPTTTLRVALFA